MTVRTRKIEFRRLAEIWARNDVAAAHGASSP